MRDGDDDLTECLECGADVSRTLDRCYVISVEDVLCFVCARRRGGTFDELADAWTVAPDVEGLADVRRASKHLRDIFRS